MSQDPILFHAPSGRWTSTNGQAAVAAWRASGRGAKRGSEAWKRGNAPITPGPILHERCRSRAILRRSNECMSTVSCRRTLRCMSTLRPRSVALWRYMSTVRPGACPRFVAGYLTYKYSVGMLSCSALVNPLAIGACAGYVSVRYAFSSATLGLATAWAYNKCKECCE